MHLSTKSTLIYKATHRSNIIDVNQLPIHVCPCKTIRRLSLALNFIEPHPPTNLSAVVQCKQGYEIQIDWQVKYS